MPTENRSSNTEMVSVPPYIGLEPLAGRYYPAQCRRCGWVGSSEELTKDDAQCTRDIGVRLCLGECDELERHDLLNIIQAMAAPQPHPEPIAWMVGTAFWWTKEEAERDAAATGLPIIGLGPMTDASEIERLVAANTEYARRHLEQLGEIKRMDKATAFVQRLVDCSGTQPSVATGYLRDILDELKGNTTPTAPVERDERAAFEHHHRICDLVRDEDCPDYYRNQSVQDSWEGWQARAEQEIRP